MAIAWKRKRRLTFEKWIKYNFALGAFDDSPDLDFVEDFIRDFKDRPRNYKTWDELENRLGFLGACDEAMKLGKKLFKRWEKKYGEEEKSFY